MDEPTVPAAIALYDYQQRAIDAWKAASFRGIFSMATGTGKTITALCAMMKCYEALQTANKERASLAVFIVCPFRHLVEQWAEDVKRFGIKPIVGYGASAQTDWRRRLKFAIEDMKHGIKGREFFAFVTTNATFASDFVQEQIKNKSCNALLIVDEAHNFGAEHLRRLLPSVFNFRLALSATLERYGDADGTQALKDYFGQKCIEYGLEQAMADGILTPYKYHPVIVNLSDKEAEDYERLSREIGRCLIAGFGGKRHLTERGKHLALQRAHIVAGAVNKLEALKAAIMPYKHDRHILVYYGAAQIVDDEENDEADNEDISIRQIDAVMSLLGNNLDMRVARFT